MPSVGIFIGITMSTPYGLPSVLSSSQCQDALELLGVVEPDAAQHAEAAGPLTAAATCSDGVKAKIGYSMPNRSQSSVRI